MRAKARAQFKAALEALGKPAVARRRGWPILQFSGLPQLSTGTFLGTIKIIDPSDDGRGRFRIIVKRKEGAIWPSPELLRQGVRTRGWVQMNQVPLWFEIWRLINDLPPATPPLTTGGESAANPPTPRSPPAEPESSSSPTTTNPVPAR